MADGILPLLSLLICRLHISWFWTKTNPCSDIPLVLFAFLGYKWIRGTKFVPLDDIPIRQALQEAEDDPENVPIGKDSIWKKVNFLWG